jgi:hypothetical protein
MASEYQHKNEHSMKISETKFINRPCSYITWNCQISLNKQKNFRLKPLLKIWPHYCFYLRMQRIENYNTELLKIKGYFAIFSTGTFRSKYKS